MSSYLRHVAGRVLDIPLSLVGLALGLAPLVAGQIAGCILDRAFDLVRRSRSHEPSPNLLMIAQDQSVKGSEGSNSRRKRFTACASNSAEARHLGSLP